MKNRKKYRPYKKFDVVCADFGDNLPGVQGGVRVGIIVSWMPATIAAHRRYPLCHLQVN